MRMQWRLYALEADEARRGAQRAAGEPCNRHWPRLKPRSKMGSVDPGARPLVGNTSGFGDRPAAGAAAALARGPDFIRLSFAMGAVGPSSPPCRKAAAVTPELD